MGVASMKHDQIKSLTPICDCGLLYLFQLEILSGVNSWAKYSSSELPRLGDIIKEMLSCINSRISGKEVRLVLQSKAINFSCETLKPKYENHNTKSKSQLSSTSNVLFLLHLYHPSNFTFTS